MKWGLLCCITNTIAADGLESAMSYGIWSIDIDLSLRPEYYGVGIIKKRIVTILYETKLRTDIPNIHTLSNFMIITSVLFRINFAYSTILAK